MLLGLWKNVEELETTINLSELELLLTAAHDREYRQNKFAAALKGINLDESGESAQEKFERIQRKVEAQATGVSEESLELDIFGLDVEIE